MSDTTTESAPSRVVDLAELLADDRDLPTGQVEVPGFGTMTVRGLSRDESMELSKVYSSKGLKETDRRMLTMGIVEPAITYEQVARWTKRATAGEIEPVTDLINELSGTSEGAERDAVARFHEGPPD